MKSFTLATLMAVAQAATLTESSSCDWSYEHIVEVFPPDSTCCDAGGNWDKNTCNPLQDAVDAAEPYTWIKVYPGTYCNKNFYKNAGLSGKADADAKALRNPVLLKVTKPYIKIEGVSSEGKTLSGDVLDNDVPLLKADGWGAIQIKNTSHVTVKYLELEGPNLTVDGPEASANRVRISGHIDTAGPDYGKLTGCSVNES